MTPQYYISISQACQLREMTSNKFDIFLDMVRDNWTDMESKCDAFFTWIKEDLIFTEQIEQIRNWLVKLTNATAYQSDMDDCKWEILGAFDAEISYHKNMRRVNRNYQQFKNLKKAQYN